MVLFPQSLRIALVAAALLAGGPAASQMVAGSRGAASEAGRAGVGGRVGTSDLSTVTVKTFDLRAHDFTSEPRPSEFSASASSTSAAADTATTPAPVDPTQAARDAMDQFLDNLPILHKRGPKP